MTNQLAAYPAKINQKKALKLIGVQTCILLLMAVIIFLGWDITYAFSAVVGGSIALIPSLIFIYYAFRFCGAQSIKMVTQSFYRGQSLKLLTTFALFSIAFKWMNVLVEPLLLTFILMLFTHWLAPFYFNQR